MKELFDSENLHKKNDKCLYIYIDRQAGRQAGRQTEIDRGRQIQDRYIDNKFFFFFKKKKKNTEQLKIIK